MEDKNQEEPGRFLNRRTKFLIRFVIYIGVGCGFTYQAGIISRDYFKYPTISFVTIEKAMPVTTMPRLVIKTRYSTLYGFPVKDVFKLIEDKTEFNDSTVKVGYDTMVKKGNSMTKIETFLHGGYYYYSFITHQPVNFTPSQLYHFNKPLSYYHLVTNVMRKVLGFFMISYGDDMEGIRKTPAMADCLNRAYCVVRLVYAFKITKLSPPPYDTNCKDYRSTTTWTSKEQCFSQCLSEFTTQHGMILGNAVIPREKLENSTLTIIPWYMKSLDMDGGKVDEAFLIKQADKLKERLSNNATTYQPQLRHHDQLQLDMFNKLVALFPHYQSHWWKCKSTCHQPNCYMESPVVQVMSMQYYNKKWKNHNATNLQIEVYPPNDLAVIVETRGKLSLIDFIVYMLSCLSFWFGFCPLHVAQKQRKTPQTRNNPQNWNSWCKKSNVKDSCHFPLISNALW